eukprot:559654-Rhodomonas_salina.1
MGAPGSGGNQFGGGNPFARSQQGGGGTGFGNWQNGHRANPFGRGIPSVLLQHVVPQAAMFADYSQHTGAYDHMQHQHPQ